MKREEFVAWALQEVMINESVAAEAALFAENVAEHDPKAAEMLREVNAILRRLGEHLTPLADEFAKKLKAELESRLGPDCERIVAVLGPDGKLNTVDALPGEEVVPARDSVKENVQAKTDAEDVITRLFSGAGLPTTSNKGPSNLN
jgi:hypothetical protein